MRKICIKEDFRGYSAWFEDKPEVIGKCDYSLAEAVLELLELSQEFEIEKID